MKKLIIWLCALILALIPAAGLAVNLNDCSIANGVVEAAEYVDLVAPYSGTLETFNLRVGDAVSAEDELMRMLVTNLYAPIDGTVSYVYAKEGDSADTVCARYGALIAIEPEQLMHLSCTTEGAYDKTENKIIHIGEIVYLRSSNNSNQTGKGTVISVDGKSYEVEITKTDGLKMGDSNVRVYRDSGYTDKSRIGKGTVVRQNDTLVSGGGRVYSVLAEAGSDVVSGELLIELMSADADLDASPIILASNDGVIGSISVEPGSSVWKGQSLLRLYLTDKLEVRAEVDEVDLKNVKIGDTIIVKLDADESNLIEGIVTRISSIGVTKSNAAYFDVYITIPTGNAKIGENASVYIPKFSIS